MSLNFRREIIVDWVLGKVLVRRERLLILEALKREGYGDSRHVSRAGLRDMVCGLRCNPPSEPSAYRGFTASGRYEIPGNFHHENMLFRLGPVLLFTSG